MASLGSPFGPVLFFDLVRTARRHRYFLIRILYVGLLAVMLLWGYALWRHNLDYPDETRPAEIARFTSSFFNTFMIVQFLAVALLTPAYTAGAIAEEKERKTLDFLLATSVTNHEIVFSKLTSRLFNVTCLILAGLPILSFLQFLGGVDPTLVVAGFAATALTALGLAGLSIVNSVVVRRARDAILLTYLEATGYLILSGLSWFLLVPRGWAMFPSTSSWTSPVTLQGVVKGLNAGNLIAAMVRLSNQVAAGGRLEAILPGLLRDYAVFHGVLALACSTWALLRLRATALTQNEEKRHSLFRGLSSRPSLRGQPIMWKELYVEPGLRWHWLGRLVLVLLIVASFVPVAVILYESLDGGRGFRNLPRAMNVWVRLVGTAVASLLLLAVAVRAAGSLTGERERQTYDALLTTPLDSDAILWGKWVGSILGMRRGWWWLGAIWTLGLLTGGLHFFALPFLVGAFLVYAAFLASLGSWFSVFSRSSQRATLWTLLSTVGAAFGHWLIWLLCLPLGRFQAADGILKFQAGLTPPFALGGYLSFSYQDLYWEDAGELLLWALFGLLIWSVAAAVIWHAASARFRFLSGRTNLPLSVSPDSLEMDHPPAEGQKEDAVALPEEGTP
jgi:ABC-type transport system involved in multi-copper enzyme maturation permease subunit